MRNRPTALTPLALASLVTTLVACESDRPTPESSPKPERPATTMPSAQPLTTRMTRPATPQPPQPKPIPAPDDVAEAPKDAKKTKTGLLTKVLAKGTGKDKPKPEDKVKVHYTGWTKDGKMFDSSVARGQPTEFGVSQVIPGWTEALQLMVAGEKRRLWIPANLAYGDSPRMGGPSGQLTFDVELLEIVAAPKPIPAPADVAKPSAGSKKSDTGLAYKSLKKGKGTTKPTATSRVTVHYTGWKKDGKMFDSSVQRGEPATFPLNGVIKGWTEGLQLMVEGEKMRFWIPADLAYGETPSRPGAPAGQLTFDVELISIQ